MGCLWFCFAISFIVLAVCNNSSTQLRFSCVVEGRRPSETSDINSETVVREEKTTLLRAQIGSRPPQCEGRCAACGHCEAIQVPTGQQVRNGDQTDVVSGTMIAYARGDSGSSNYKPMSWKCKCGNLIFNP